MWRYNCPGEQEPGVDNIPRGTEQKLARSPALVPQKKRAGTMVVGMDQKPPRRPPRRSMATVAPMATSAAKIYDTMGPK